MYQVALNDQVIPHRKRAIREEVRKSRTALTLVMPLNQQISHWQSAVARLVTAAERARTHAQRCPAHLEEIDAIESMVRVHQHRLLEGVADLPLDVRDNGRIADTSRALDSVLAGLDRARSLLSS